MKSLVLVLLSFPCFAHKPLEGSHPQADKTVNSDLNEQIRSSYQQKIAPIFKSKCANCHGGPTQYPWYYLLPGVKQFIDHDISEGKEHLDISKGFPFAGHANLIKDLDAIAEEAVDSNEMPPWYYRIFHSGSRLNGDEKEAVRKWVEESRKKLSPPP